jgi:hypothetical protein
MEYDYKEEPEMIRWSAAGILCGIIFMIIICCLCSCTVTFQNIHTMGTASEVGDDALSTSADLQATVPLVP